LSNEEKTKDYENFEKKGEVVEKRGEEETKSMHHAPVANTHFRQLNLLLEKPAASLY
jgi:hypothetical protein